MLGSPVEHRNLHYYKPRLASLFSHAGPLCEERGVEAQSLSGPILVREPGQGPETAASTTFHPDAAEEGSELWEPVHHAGQRYFQVCSWAVVPPDGTHRATSL